MNFNFEISRVDYQWYQNFCSTVEAQSSCNILFCKILVDSGLFINITILSGFQVDLKEIYKACNLTTGVGPGQTAG